MIRRVVFDMAGTTVNEDTVVYKTLQNAINEEKSIKYIHEMPTGEVIDQYVNSIVLLFKQIYTLDIAGLKKSQQNYIYYGVTFIFVYIVLKLLWQEVNA